MYCFESVDNGDNLAALTLDVTSGFEVRPAPDLPSGTLQILATGLRRDEPHGAFVPYGPASVTATAEHSLQLAAVPYHLWGNRGAGEMAVWLRRHRGG